MDRSEELFRVETLDEITPHHFEMAAVACMAEEEHLAGILGVPCGSSWTLYQNGEAKVTLRNWSKMLELFVTCKNGKWLVCSHIEGRGVDGTIKEAYRQFKEAKPYIKKNCERAFAQTKLKKDAASRWLAGTEKIMQDITDFVKTREAQE